AGASETAAIRATNRLLRITNSTSDEDGRTARATSSDWRPASVRCAFFAALVGQRIFAAAPRFPMTEKARALSRKSHSVSSLEPPSEMPPTGPDTPAEPPTRQGADGIASGEYAKGAWRTCLYTVV